MGKTKSRVFNQVRKLRFMNNEMTQGNLAKSIGVSRQTIIAIEQGKFCPSLESALKISEVFNTPMEQIFTLEKDEQK